MTPRVRIFAAAIVIVLTGFVTRGSSTALAEQDRELKPVTEAALTSPDPADWPNWRRTLDGWGYSPLNQINKQNAHQLQLAWSWALQPGVSQPNPIVANGVMYIPIPGGGAQALDAATGELLWEFKSTPKDGRPRTGPMRNLAIYGDKVYVAAADARLIALSARTGEVVWDHQVADSKLGYGYSSGPIVAKGMIVAGISGCARYKEDVCFISAHDSETGKELWRLVSAAATPGAICRSCSAPAAMPGSPAATIRNRI
jgi:alcohol dehydrogenase (cytochrome c)